ncbi:S-formylglutathione hydrolase-like isoform X2 [Symsagittifera roscoffensis]|uniref:S-formylglutathione hydrolase-like isoform X2 n=1 Tax=Symsagittifera roscoffensis TaxID=84072 RepID=UPI00307B724C
MTGAEEISCEKFFGGLQKNKELSLKTEINFYLPPKAVAGGKCPVIYYISGMTCDVDIHVQRAGYQRYASELNLIIVSPDTSPRGAGVDGEEGERNLGTGAGFYLDATEEKWKKHYRMYSYVVEELPEIVKAAIPQADLDKVGIIGHSMGGHGALSIYLKNPDKYKSCSVLAPILNPINSPLCQKPFTSYLGSDKSTWGQYDCSEILKNISEESFKLLRPILIDMGTMDKYLIGGELLPEPFLEIAKKRGLDLNYRMQDGYYHAYGLVSTFMGEHLEHHANLLSSI